ncbi:hypothetical protein AB0J35_00985 [Nonomuraea angiospora]|uniref:hypothetical protein n=1 Tax=Nonomuraea angiospora TaxID=46172 RepID=UPI003444B67A
MLGALMLAALTFNTAENLPVGLLELISADLRVSLSAVGLLVTGYGVTVAVASVPIAHVVRAVPRRYVLTALLAELSRRTPVPTTPASRRVPRLGDWSCRSPRYGAPSSPAGC